MHNSTFAQQKGTKLSGTVLVTLRKWIWRVACLLQYFIIITEIGYIPARARPAGVSYS